MHLVVSGWPLITGLAGAVFDIYGPNNVGAICYVSDYPKGCIGSDCKDELPGSLVELRTVLWYSP
jgi:hypothetical protein